VAKLGARVIENFLESYCPPHKTRSQTVPPAARPPQSWPLARIAQTFPLVIHDAYPTYPMSTIWQRY